MLFLNFNFSQIQLHVLNSEGRKWRRGGRRLKDVNAYLVQIL